MSWSSGKDSAYALGKLMENEDFEVTALFTTVNQEFDRVAMHAVRTSLLQAQAKQIGLPLYIIYLPNPCSNTTYNECMNRFISKASAANVDCFAFGDLFLEEVRSYRIKQLSGTGIEPLFPIWGTDTRILSRVMTQKGLKSIITCIDERKLKPEFLGRIYNDQFLDDLPLGVDPCGENGEFHSFVYQCELYSEGLKIKKGSERKSIDGFMFQDVLLQSF